jgi:3-deoxy-D-manno-octulosonic-acid transferase
MYVLYSLLLAAAALLSLPWWALQMLRLGKYRAGFTERLGFVPERLQGAKQDSIWGTPFPWAKSWRSASSSRN